MLQLIFQRILFPFFIHRRKTCMTESDFPLQCFIYKKGLAHTPTSIYCYKLRFFAVIQFIKFSNLFFSTYD